MRFPTYPFEKDKGRLAGVPKIGEGAWRILMYLIANADDSPVEGELGRAGVIKVSRLTLARQTGLAPRTVQEAVERLVSIGAIGADTRNGRTTVYKVFPRWVPPVDSTPLPTIRADGFTRQLPHGSTRQEVMGAAVNSTSCEDAHHREVDGATRQDSAHADGSTRQPYTDSRLPRTHVQNTNTTQTPGPLHPTERADWNHEGKPTEAHWRALEDLTWRTYGIAMDRAALDWYDMDAWRRRMTTLTDAQAS